MSLDTLSLSPSQRASLEEATSRYEAALDQRAASYLIGRGLDRDAATGSRLGKVSDPIPGHEKFADMLSIPYVTPAGVVGFKFRCIRDHDCKAEGCQRYDSPTGQKARLYGVESLQDRGDTIYIVEGELARIVMRYVVGVPCVGTPSTQWHDHWPRCFADFEHKVVIADHDVTAKGDSPGIKHAKKVVSSMSGAELVLPPPGHDPDSWVLEYGVDVVRKGLGL